MNIYFIDVAKHTEKHQGSCNVISKSEYIFVLELKIIYIYIYMYDLYAKYIYRVFVKFNFQREN